MKIQLREIKTIIMVKKIVLIFFFLAASAAYSQKPTIGIVNIASSGIVYNTSLLADLTRIEVEKTRIYEVIPKEDILLLCKNTRFKPDSCFGKQCLMDIGKQIKADYMLLGSVEQFDKRIFVMYKLYDVKNAVEVNSVVEDYRSTEDITAFVRLTLTKMFQQPFVVLHAKEKQPDSSYAKINVPQKNKDRSKRFGIHSFSLNYYPVSFGKGERGTHLGFGVNITPDISFQQEFKNIAGNTFSGQLGGYSGSLHGFAMYEELRFYMNFRKIKVYIGPQYAINHLTYDLTSFSHPDGFQMPVNGKALDKVMHYNFKIGTVIPIWKYLKVDVFSGFGKYASTTTVDSGLQVLGGASIRLGSK